MTISYLGIRPENIDLNQENEIKLELKVELVENLGFEKIIYTSLSNNEINIKTKKDIKNQSIKVSFSKENIYLFDKNKNRIRQ